MVESKEAIDPFEHVSLGAKWPDDAAIVRLPHAFGLHLRAVRFAKPVVPSLGGPKISEQICVHAEHGCNSLAKHTKRNRVGLF